MAYNRLTHCHSLCVCDILVVRGALICADQDYICGFKPRKKWLTFHEVHVRGVVGGSGRL